MSIYKHFLFNSLSGFDRIEAFIGNDRFNEIKQFIQGRYVSACEAAWRLLKFPIQGHSPVVYRLGVHLPDQHPVTFLQTNQDNEANTNEDTNININNLIDDTSELNRRAQLQNLINKNSDSTLMAWFKLNETQEAARQHLYRDIPKFYTFDS